MAVKSAREIQIQILEAAKRLKDVRSAAEANRERQREGEPTVIPTAQTPLGSRGALRGKD